MSGTNLPEVPCLCPAGALVYDDSTGRLRLPRSDDDKTFTVFGSELGPTTAPVNLRGMPPSWFEQQRALAKT